MLLDPAASLADGVCDARVEELDPLRGIVAGVVGILDECAPSGAGAEAGEALQATGVFRRGSSATSIAGSLGPPNALDNDT